MDKTADYITLATIGLLIVASGAMISSIFMQSAAYRRCRAGIRSCHEQCWNSAASFFRRIERQPNSEAKALEVELLSSQSPS